MSSRVVVKPATVALVVVGVVLIILAVVYFATPAKDLPGFIPGHQAGLTRHHMTHGAAALVPGLLAWAGAWFTTNPGSDAA